MNSKNTQFKKGKSPWNKGTKLSPEGRLKLSLSAKQRGQIPPSRKGKNMPAWFIEMRKGHTPWNKGTTGIMKSWNKGKKTGPVSIEIRRKMSQAKRKSKYTKEWKELCDFIRKCFEYRLWRSDVFHRDNYTCQFCKDKRGGNLEVDHIKPFAVILKENNIVTFEEAVRCQELWSVNNGRTLCKSCHKKTDTWGHKTRQKICKNN